MTINSNDQPIVQTILLVLLIAVKSELFFTYFYCSANISGVLGVVLTDIDSPSKHWCAVKKSVLFIVKMSISIHSNLRDTL